MSSEHQLVWFDFTLSASAVKDYKEVKDYLKEGCDKWAFQRELSETGFDHYQGRVHLTGKGKRLQTLINQKPWPELSWSITNKRCYNNFDYVTKSETRKDGPWTWQDQVLCVPSDVQDVVDKGTLHPYQLKLVSILETKPDKRHIHCVVDDASLRLYAEGFTGGNIGKTWLVRFCMAFKKALFIPYCNDFKEITGMAHNLYTDQLKNGKIINNFIFDMPRAIGKKNLQGLFMGIESIKNGIHFEQRYHFKQELTDQPNVLVFLNGITKEMLGFLSQDRWVLWTVNDKLELVEYPKDKIEGYTPKPTAQASIVKQEPLDNNYKPDHIYMPGTVPQILDY